MRSRGLLIGVLLLVAVIVVLIGAAFSLLRGGTVYPGVRVADVDVGGLTLKQANDRLAKAAQTMGAKPIALKYPGGEVQTTAFELGGTLDVKGSAESAWRIGRQGSILHRLFEVLVSHREGLVVPLTQGYDNKTASAYLHKLALKIDRHPWDARLVPDGGSVRITPEKQGVKLDVPASVDGIEKAVNSGAKEYALVVKTALPEVTSEDLNGIDGVLACYSTRFKPWEKDRTHNLLLACRSIDGTMIKPNEVFSYNRIVGPRLKSTGYREAPIFVDGEVEAGTGGGICQVCTTMYNAALLSNMKIVRRSHHSRPVHYAPVGRDATVAWPSTDFKFKNSTDTPIYITATLGKSTVNVCIFGKKQDGLHVEVVSSGHEVIPVRNSTEVRDSAPDEHKKPHKGHRVSIFRVVKQGDEVVRRELISRDYYRPSTVYASKPVKPAEKTVESAPVHP